MFFLCTCRAVGLHVWLNVVIFYFFYILSFNIKIISLSHFLIFLSDYCYFLIYFRGIPLTCNCSTKWLKELALTGVTIVTDEQPCVAPVELVDAFWNSLEQNDFQIDCKGTVRLSLYHKLCIDFNILYLHWTSSN